MCSPMLAALVLTTLVFPTLPWLSGFGSLISLRVLIVSVRIVVGHGNSSEVETGNALLWMNCNRCATAGVSSISMLARGKWRALTIFAAHPAYISAASMRFFRKDYKTGGCGLLLAQYGQLLRVTQACIE